MTAAQRPPLAGVFPIVSSPFDASGTLDPDALDALCTFIAGSGVDGAVYPAIASEFATLTRDERSFGVARVARALRGRIAFVVGIADETAALSAEHARQAAELGADAVMLMAPRSAGTSVESVVAFCTAALGDVALPVILQNAPPPLGSSLDIATLRAVCARIPAIRYIKEEVVPCGQRISALRAGIPGLSGIFGGAGGRFVMDELARGAAGSMPACEIPEMHVALFRAVAEGRADEARTLFDRMLPLLNMGGVYRTPITKHILVQRGVIPHARHRDANPVLDGFDQRELAAIWARLEPHVARVARGAP